MATTDAPHASETGTGEERERDQQGATRAHASVLRDPVELRHKLLGVFQAAVHDARESVQAVDVDATGAVHDARKALRRARAVLSLMSGALPKSERRAVKEALQAARRSLSTVRDHAVAPDTFAEIQLDDEDRGTGKRVLENAAEAAPAATEIKQLLGDAATKAAVQAEALEAALPGEIRWSTVIEGLASVYGEARTARRKAKRSKQAFHTWRRRTKELGYQLEIIGEMAGPRVHAVKSEIDAVSDTLGPAVDRIMLREFVETHGLGIPADAVGRLRTAIDAQLDDLMDAARKVASDSFEVKPSKFARRIAKTVKRDLASPDDRDGSSAANDNDDDDSDS